MKRIVPYVVVLGLLLMATSSSAQVGRGGVRPAENVVRQRIVQMLMKQSHDVLALSDDQMPRLQRVVSEWAQRQLLLEQDEHVMRQALDAQMRPGVAAVAADSLPKLVYGISSNRVRQAQSLDDETHQLGAFLNPVQLAQFHLIQERLLRNIQNLPKVRAPLPN